MCAMLYSGTEVERARFRKKDLERIVCKIQDKIKDKRGENERGSS